MIEWKKYDENNPPELNKDFLICNRYSAVYVAELRNPFGDDNLEWMDGEDCYLHFVTHYAEINLPK